MDWITVELLSIIIVLIGGFGTLSYQVGGWRRVIEETRDRLDAHAQQCREREGTIEERLARGGAAITRLEEGQKYIQKDLDEIKGILHRKE